MKLGIDLGGSHIAAGIMDDECNILKKVEENFTLEEKQNIEKVLVPKIIRVIQELMCDNIESIRNSMPRYSI